MDGETGEVQAAPSGAKSRAEIQSQISATLDSPDVERTGGWTPQGFRPDLPLLGRLLCLADPANTQAAHVATTLDMWVADQLTVAGLRGIVPRRERPRYIGELAADIHDSGVLERLETLLGELALASQQLSATLTTLDRTASRSVAPHAVSVARIHRQLNAGLRALRRLVDRSATTVLGEGRYKQIDVFLARADRGLELAVSTKTLAVSVGESGEHGKNLVNRWEEFDGDLKNLRGRFPLAVIGALLLVSTALFETEAFGAAADMLSKLTAEGRPWVNAYDAATIIVAAPWTQGQRDPVSILSLQDMQARYPDFPENLAAERFFDTLLQRLFERAPSSDHRAARQSMAASKRGTMAAATLAKAFTLPPDTPEAQG